MFRALQDTATGYGCLIVVPLSSACLAWQCVAGHENLLVCSCNQVLELSACSVARACSYVMLRTLPDAHARSA